MPNAGRRLRVVLAASLSLLLLGFALYGALDVIPRQYPGAASRVAAPGYPLPARDADAAERERQQ